jgi:hypothetical protein
VRIHKFTSGKDIISVKQAQVEKGRRREGNLIILIVAFKFLRLMLAIGFGLVLPWAVIESIGMRGYIVV